MKSSTIKEAGIVALVVLCAVLLWQNRGMSDRLRQYRAVEAFLAEEERTGDECIEALDNLEPLEDTAKGMLLVAAAQKGSARAQYCLGMYGCWMEQFPSIQDIKGKREKWLEKASQQGDSGYMHDLADWYFRDSEGEDGAAREKALQQAFYWYREGALRNHAQCMAKLGRMYLDGAGVKADADQAEYWFKKAEAAGCPGTLLEEWRARRVIPQDAR